jgi:hypothetical protein
MKSIIKEKFLKKTYRGIIAQRTSIIEYFQLFYGQLYKHHDSLLVQYFIQNIMKLELDKDYNIYCDIT